MWVCACVFVCVCARVYVCTHTHSHTHIHRVDQRGLSDAEVADWKANTEYKGLSPTDQIVKWFWQVLKILNVVLKILNSVLKIHIFVLRVSLLLIKLGRHTPSESAAICTVIFLCFNFFYSSSKAGAPHAERKCFNFAPARQLHPEVTYIIIFYHYLF